MLDAHFSMVMMSPQIALVVLVVPSVAMRGKALLDERYLHLVFIDGKEWPWK
jgi:hypothetical protein